MSIVQAHRARRARRIIRDAFRARPNASRANIVRYYLIGEAVAAAVVSENAAARHATSVLVARDRPGGRAVRLRDDCRTGLTDWRQLMAHVEQLHAKHGAPLVSAGRARQPSTIP